MSDGCGSRHPGSGQQGQELSPSLPQPWGSLPPLHRGSDQQGPELSPSLPRPWGCSPLSPAWTYHPWGLEQMHCSLRPRDSVSVPR